MGIAYNSLHLRTEMFSERNNTLLQQLGSCVVLLVVASTLMAAVLQDLAPVTVSVADPATEQSEGTEDPTPETTLTVAQAVTSSVQLSLDSQYFLIDILPLPEAVVSYPLRDITRYQAGLKFSRILFRRIISPNGP